MKKILLGLVILCMFAGNAMAVGSSTSVTILKRNNEGASRVVYGYITYASESYVTLGMELTPRDLGLDAIRNLTVSGVSSSTIGYNYDYTNEKIRLYYTENNPYEPTASPATNDYFIVTDDNSAATNGKLLVIGATNGGDPYFGYMDATGVTSAATAHYSYFTAADSVTSIGVVDSTRAIFHELGVLIHADTIFFDDNATNSYDRLMYSGTGLGDMGDIYIPFDNGNMIKITKKTNSQITQAAALPLYFDENAGLDDKLLSVTNGNANSTFSCDITYTFLPQYNPVGTEEIPNGASVTAIVYFMAVGN